MIGCAASDFLKEMIHVAPWSHSETWHRAWQLPLSNRPFLGRLGRQNRSHSRANQTW